MNKVIEAIKLNSRGLKILYRDMPKYFISSIFLQIIKAITPFVAIYISAQLLGELSTKRDPSTIWSWVWISIISTSILTLLTVLLTRWVNIFFRDSFSWATFQNFYRKKRLNMDFCVTDSNSIRELRAQIKQNHNYNGWGLFILATNIFPKFINSFISIIASITLSYKLFTLDVTNSNLLFLNSPISIFITIIIMILLLVLSPLFAAKANSFWAKFADAATFGNKVFFFFFNEVHSKDRALDTRMYHQEVLAANYIKEHNTVASKSPIVKDFAKNTGFLNSISSASFSLFSGFLYAFVALKALGGAFGIGAVTQYIGAILLLATGLTDSLTSIGTMIGNAPFLKASFEFLDTPNPMYQGSLTTEKRSDNKYDIEFKNVSFKYPDTDDYILKNVSVKFEVGKKLAIVGQNGSGKTTFIKLLCRLYDPTEGEILLNGINIKKYNYDDYINIFSVVFQDFKLLAYSLAENVATSVNYDKEKVIDCLMKSGFKDKLEKSPNGIETILYKDLSNDGIEISGGEAQKIALARALYKDSSFIILDEPTAALDPIAESEIYERFNDIVDNRTAIYISHRLSSCKFCDEIIVFNDGSIVEFGTHSDLLNKDGEYSTLWNAQAQYYAKQ